jgi:threonine synthase
MRSLILGASVSDDETRKTIAGIHAGCAYFLEPHGAVGWRAVEDLAGKKLLSEGPLAVLATAHPAKFAETVEPLTGPVPVPPSLRKTMERTAEARTIPADIAALLDVL